MTTSPDTETAWAGASGDVDDLVTDAVRTCLDGIGDTRDETSTWRGHVCALRTRLYEIREVALRQTLSEPGGDRSGTALE
jgi:hypothetical protein